MPFDTPQDAEDAFYDALESSDADAMAQIWESSEDIACLLPMIPLIQGAEVLEMWRAMLEQGAGFDIHVRHLGWIETPDMALHMIEERMGGPEGASPNGQSVYGSNLFRRGSDGWRLVMHQNSPTPPPPGAINQGPVPN